MQEDAVTTLRKWQEDIDQRNLAEKRRLAPGWLDREEKILEPEKTYENRSIDDVDNSMDMQGVRPQERSLTKEITAEGEQLDRAFGGMGLRNST